MSKENNPNNWPKSSRELVNGLNQAIENTQIKIAKEGSTPDLEFHLKKLQEKLKEAEDEMNYKKAA